MPRERDIRLDEYRISSNAYRELKYFCRQYGEKRAALSRQRFVEGTPHARQFSGETLCARQEQPGGTDALRLPAIPAAQGGDAQARAGKHQRDLKLIEDTVMEAAGPAMYRQLLLNVTEGVRYEYLGDAPCGRELFYKLRRRFFYLLYCRRN